VVERGSVSFAEKARCLQAAGAAAVLVLNVAEATMCCRAWLGILALASWCQSRVPAAHGVRKRHTQLMTHV
jgi:hypothetical protein